MVIHSRQLLTRIKHQVISCEGVPDISTICAVPMLSLKVSWNSSKRGEQRFKIWEIVKVSPTKLCLEGSEWSNFGIFVWYSHLFTTGHCFQSVVAHAENSTVLNF